jgi:cell division protein FtsN
MSVAPEPVPVEPKAKPEPKTKPEPAAEKAIRAEPKKVEKAPSAAQVQVRAGTLVTPGWTAAPVFVVHFSSFQEKARAEKHAAVLAKELGLPVRAVQVDLGDKGTWYRSVAGEFQTAEEALALRATLLEKGTQGVGLVYRMTGKK